MQPTGLKKFNSSKGPSEDVSNPLESKKKALTEQGTKGREEIERQNWENDEVLGREHH